MALADIDAGATRRRIQEIADGARAAFETHAQRSAEIDAASREAAAKEEADLEAVRERRAELEARKAAEETAAQQPEKPKPAKPSTLSLGAEEFKLDREARRPTPTAPVTAEPEPAEPAATDPTPTSKEEPRRTLKLGARDDEDTPEPVRKRPPRPQADDDLSGRTWLR